ncbi:ABC1 kinase family protein [Phaeocystidibacter marisrubri]|uniref:AarF/ABC1/UbiB kinase family protein n=1 Tax=Phaeocystidibacter marisrubri TaxID=1577780 RepID=A0A6L3ZJB0_9FLAO|nr:AarF/ABC1/UbiB kinase family protein [Phaeocystidibacter marisrubri]KAB2817709.1 AarF/ABC1/UbiB kinase family protein [Phaeocystidibacter marisrubri]GGH73978.1 ABC transporter [Phaeocystidibacter marisrubri]
MKEQDKIPTSRGARTGRFIKTGAQIGGNYLKHYAKKLVNSEASDEDLHKANAQDIYGALSELKGSALKVAQMMSMDQGILPEAYTNQFSLAQYSAPPLSYPLVVRTFQKAFQKSPTDVFDTFSKSAISAASMGQVHRAELDGKLLAVKIQYPGVQDSLESDMRIVKPMAARLFQLNNSDIDHYLEEVAGRMKEECDYSLELKRSVEISKACAHISGLTFPTYYPELSSDRILTMDWMEGVHLKEFTESNPSYEVRQKVGQALWDFYDYQIHELKSLHADPHPGNFLIREDGTVGVIDFGCVKNLPEKFYHSFFKLTDAEILTNDQKLDDALLELEFYNESDDLELKEFISSTMREFLSLLGRPFMEEKFDFGDESYIKAVFELGQRFGKDSKIRKIGAGRGPADAIYLNRTYFGLYTLLNRLGVQVRTSRNK